MAAFIDQRLHLPEAPSELETSREAVHTKGRPGKSLLPIWLEKISLASRGETTEQMTADLQIFSPLEGEAFP